MTRCEITTFDSADVYDLPYDDDERVQKLILNASCIASSFRAGLLLPSANSDCSLFSRASPPGSAKL